MRKRSVLMLVFVLTGGIHAAAQNQNVNKIPAKVLDWKFGKRDMQLRIPDSTFAPTKTGFYDLGKVTVGPTGVFEFTLPDGAKHPVIKDVLQGNPSFIEGVSCKGAVRVSNSKAAVYDLSIRVEGVFTINGKVRKISPTFSDVTLSGKDTSVEVKPFYFNFASTYSGKQKCDEFNYAYDVKAVQGWNLIVQESAGYDKKLYSSKNANVMTWRIQD